METENAKPACRLVLMVCIAAALCSGLAVLAVEPSALIRNRMVTPGGGKEVDAAVQVVAIDSLTVDGELSEVEVAPGKHRIEVVCTARVFVGMGTVDFPNRAILAIQVESGRVYQLDARVTVKGECAPVLQ